MAHDRLRWAGGWAGCSMVNICRLSLCLWFSCLCGLVWAQEPPLRTEPAKTSPDPVVMIVGQRKITASQLCAAIERLPPPQRKGYIAHPELAEQWFGPLVALAEEAKREHLGGSVGAEDMRGVDRESALAGELIQAISRSIAPTESEIDNYYASHKSQFEQVKARHILVSEATAMASRSSRSAAEARAKIEGIASRLKRGADFSRLASEESDDPDTKNKGGELGYITHHQMEPAVDQVLWSLTPGETSAPFEGRFGYQIVEVEERRTLPLNSVRELIIGNIRAEVLDRRQKLIIAAAHIRMEQIYLDSGLPCKADPSP